jgi:hypothetical protein
MDIEGKDLKKLKCAVIMAVALAMGSSHKKTHCVLEYQDVV